MSMYCHPDDEPGYEFPNEHAAAFDLSRREFRSGMAEINALVAQGLHVVAAFGPAHCRFTDAIVGTSYSVVSSHLSRRMADRIVSNLYARDAEDTCGWDGGYAVFPRLPEPPKAEPAPRASYLSDDDIPF